MKTCKVCGALMDDREWNCPECGATMIQSSGGLSLKANEETKKKKGNPMGMTISTGSGLTDILRADEPEDVEVEDEFYGGSMPISMSKTIIEDEEARKKAKANKRLIGNIVKLVILALIAFGIYTIVSKVLTREKGANSYKEVVDLYVKAINDNNQTLMLSIVPKYVSDRQGDAKDIIDEMKDVKITGYTILSEEEIPLSARNILRDQIKLSTGKVATLDEGYILEVEFTGKVGNGDTYKSTVTMELYRANARWYLYTTTFTNPVFEK